MHLIYPYDIEEKHTIATQKSTSDLDLEINTMKNIAFV